MSARLFVALELPDEVRDTLAAWCPRDAALRPVAPESLHLTLAFLGAREEEAMEAIGALLAPLARPVSALSLRDARWLPPRRPRVLAVGVEDGDGALAALQREVAAALEREAGYVPERRAFLAHVTVARVRDGARPGAGALPPPAAPAFAGEALTLYRSRLGAGGARYEAVERVALH